MPVGVKLVGRAHEERAILDFAGNDSIPSTGSAPEPRT
jgi:hypothetical protein